MTGQLGDIWNITSGTRQPQQDNREMTARTGQPKHDSWDRTEGDRSVRTGLCWARSYLHGNMD